MDLRLLKETRSKGISDRDGLKIVEQEILQHQAGLSLADRCKMLKRKQNISIKLHQLQKPYAQAKIKVKRIDKLKPPNKTKLGEKRMLERIELVERMQYCFTSRREVYILDEVIFS